MTGPSRQRGEQGVRACRVRRGTILIAVLLVLTISALAGTTAMYYGEAAAAGAEVTLKRTRSRAMAWSGVQALMAELDTQREQLLNGEAPLVTTQWQVFENGGKRGIVRLVALEKDDAGLERWVVSESAKLDLNRATAEMLAKLGPMSEEKSASVVTARDKGFGSVEELVRVAGLGDLVGAGDGAASGRNASAANEPTTGGEARLTSLLTVFSFDPNIQSGIDPGGVDAKGKLRVNLNTTWSEELGTAIRQRFGADAVNSAKALFDAGQSFKTMADLVGVLKKTNVPKEAWAAILDAFTVSPDPYLPGKVDINRATARVIAAIPGFTIESAEAVVQRRQGVESAARRSITWPLTEGILKDEEFVKAVDWLTTRSMQWRARIEVGVIDIAGEERSEGSRAPTLDERMVLEAVIDVASERPRVAYLRDVTLLDAAAVLGASLAAQDEGKKDDRTPEETADTGKEAAGAGLDMDASLKMSAGLDFGNKEASSAPTARAGESAPVVKAEAPESAPAPKDRRIGRWTGRTGINGSATAKEGGVP